MHQPRVVHRGEALAGADEHAQHLAPRRRLREPGAHRAARHQLHRDEDLFIEGAGVVHGDDVRVLEPGRGLRLPQQPAAQLGRARAAHHLDRHVSPQLRVERAEDAAHRAFTEQPGDAVAANHLVHHRRATAAAGRGRGHFEAGLDAHQAGDDGAAFLAALQVARLLRVGLRLPLCDAGQEVLGQVRHGPVTVQAPARCVPV